MPSVVLGCETDSVEDEAMVSALETAAKLAHRAESISEFEMRVAYVGHELSGLDPLLAVNLLVVVQQRAAGGHARYCDLALACDVYLAQPQAVELRVVLHSAAVTAQHQSLASDLAPPAAERKAAEAKVPDFGMGRPLSLGERKALARTSNRNLLLRVLRDPSAAVIEIMLQNPHLTEADVIRLCALRPIPGDVLRVVFRCTRWVRHYNVRLAMIKNPRCPRDVAVALVPHLLAQDARLIADSPDLHEEIRSRCAKATREVMVH